MPELTQCPQCQRKLNVQEEQLGQTVQCPVCGAFFTAAVMAPQRPPAPPVNVPDLGPRRFEDAPQPPPLPPPDRDYDDRRPRYDDDYGRRRGGYPPRRGRYPDPYADPLPHRGGVILALGLTGMLLSCVPLAGWILGGIALSMANTDLPRIDRGYMDREGRGLTVGGQVCAIIGIIISSLLMMAICSGALNDFR